jgi:tetratricopeptide (TPR) repeat protein
MSAPLRVRALQAAGHLAFEQHDAQTAQRHFAGALALCRNLDDPIALAAALYSVGRATWLQGDRRQARDFYLEALALRRAQGDRMGLARVLNGLGLVAMSLREYEDAVHYFEESAALDQTLGNHKDLARTLFNMGLVMVRMEEGAHHAVQHFEASIALCRQLGYARIEAYASNNLAMLRLHHGEPDQAAGLAQASLHLCQTLPDRLGAAYALINLGHSAVDQHKLPLAYRYFQESLAFIRQLDGHARGEVTVWWLEGMVHLLAAEERPAQAIQLAGAAVALRASTGDNLPTTARIYWAQIVERLHCQADPSAFAAAWAEGATLTSEAAIGIATAIKLAEEKKMSYDASIQSGSVWANTVPVQLVGVAQ